MKKIDVKQEGMKIPKIEYDVYSKLNGSKLIKLNLSVCENDKITISIPVSLSENIDILNSSSSYYNNICYKATSENGTDISLKDRKNEFVNNNKTLCQEDCELIDYNYTTKKAICSCQVKESSSTFADMNINKTKLLENIKDIKSFLNLNLLLCLDNLFKSESIIYNIGFYIITFIIIFHIINNFIFFLKKFRLIKYKITNIISGIKNYKLIKTDKTGKKNRLITKGNLIKTDNNNEIITLSKRNKKKNKRKKSKKNNNKLSEQKEILNINIDSHNYNNIIIDKNNKKKKKKRKTSKKIRNEQNKKNNNNKNLKSQNLIEKARKTMKFIDDEINKLPYELAIVCDKRKYFEYFIIKNKTSFNIFLFL